MANFQTNLPQGSPLVSPNLQITPTWLQFFLVLWNRTGGANGSATLILDTISSIVGSILVRGASVWQGVAPGAKYKVLRMGAALPEWDSLDGNSFAAQAVAKFFSGPSAGAPAIPSFRSIVSQDLPAGQYPGTGTNDNAQVGNVGEDFSSTIASGAAVALTTLVAKDITSINLTPGDWDVWGNLATTAGVTTANGWINTVSATDPTAPNGGCYAQWGAGISCLPLGMMRISVAALTTVYLSIDATFPGAVSAYGFIGARRRR